MAYPPRREVYVIRREIEVGTDDDAREVLCEIEFSYYPGAPARYLPWPGDPPEPADVEFRGAQVIEGNARRPLTDEEDTALDAWWWKHGEQIAVDYAASEGVA